MTPNQILRDAGIDPANHYLVRLEGHHQFSFQDKGNEPIHVHNHEQFISLSIGPTPLS
jgi:hypothetical protein